MKTIKKLLLLTAITVLSFIALSCSTDELIEEQPVAGECECVRENYELTFDIVNSTTIWTETLTDRFVVPCQEERERVFFDEEPPIYQFYNITC